MLGTSDAWLTIHLSQGTREPGYYTIDCQILQLQIQLILYFYSFQGFFICVKVQQPHLSIFVIFTFSIKFALRQFYVLPFFANFML